MFLLRFTVVFLEQCPCRVIHSTVLWRAIICYRLRACQSYRTWLPLWGSSEDRTGQSAVTDAPCNARRCRRRRQTLVAAAAVRATVPVRIKVGVTSSLWREQWLWRVVTVWKDEGKGSHRKGAGMSPKWPAEKKDTRAVTANIGLRLEQVTRLSVKWKCVHSIPHTHT